MASAVLISYRDVIFVFVSSFARCATSCLFRQHLSISHIQWRRAMLFHFYFFLSLLQVLVRVKGLEVEKPKVHTKGSCSPLRKLLKCLKRPLRSPGFNAVKF